MLYLHSQHSSHEFGAKTLEAMQQYRIAAVPKNYVVWYAYVSGVDENLRAAIDVLISNNTAFTDELNDQLYNQYFGMESDSLVGKTGQQLDTLLQDAISTMSTAGSSAVEYGKTLDGMSEQLDQGPQDVKAIVLNLIAETQKMQETNVALKSRLDGAIADVQTLQNDLDQARAQAYIDSLTNIPNRKRFDIALRETAVAAMELGDPMSLLFMDIDFFKKFNDNHGHQLGDRVLQLVAATLIQNIKGNDIAARYGGEEFAVILPKTTLANAITVGNHLREAVASKKIVRKKSGDPLGSITMSIGAAEFRFGEPLTDFVERSDAALYTAKKLGRNRVVSEADIDPSLSIVA